MKRGPGVSLKSISVTARLLQELGDATNKERLAYLPELTLLDISREQNVQVFMSTEHACEDLADRLGNFRSIRRFDHAGNAQRYAVTRSTLVTDYCQIRGFHVGSRLETRHQFPLQASFRHTVLLAAKKHNLNQTDSGQKSVD